MLPTLGWEFDQGAVMPRNDISTGGPVVDTQNSTLVRDIQSANSATNAQEAKPQPVADQVTLSDKARESLNKTHVSAAHSTRETGQSSESAAQLVETVLSEIRDRNHLKEQIKSVAARVEKLRERAETLLAGAPDTATLGEKLTASTLSVQLPEQDHRPLGVVEVEAADPPETPRPEPQAASQGTNPPAISTGLET